MNTLISFFSSSSLSLVYRDAWNGVKGLSKEDAMKKYVEKLLEARRNRLGRVAFLSLNRLCCRSSLPLGTRSTQRRSSRREWASESDVPTDQGKMMLVVHTHADCHRAELYSYYTRWYEHDEMRITQGWRAEGGWRARYTLIDRNTIRAFEMGNRMVVRWDLV